MGFTLWMVPNFGDWNSNLDMPELRVCFDESKKSCKCGDDEALLWQRWKRARRWWAWAGRQLGWTVGRHVDVG